MLTAALAVGHLVAGKSLREGLFLSTFSIGDLPKAMLAAAVVSIPFAWGSGRWMIWRGPGSLAPSLLLLSGLGSLAEWTLLPMAPCATTWLVYLHVSLAGSLSMSALWSVVNEKFDPHALKQQVGRIAASATFGGLVSGAAMERMAHWLDARTTLLLVAALALVAAFAARTLAQTHAPAGAARADSEPHEPRVQGAYLWTLALLVACSAIASTFADYGMKQAAVGRYERAEDLVRFFAVFYTGASLLGFLLQMFVARRLFNAIGVGGVLATAPACGVLLAAFACASPSFLTSVLLRGSDLTLGPSLFRSAFEPLFTPLPSVTKRGAKALIDVVFDKGGDALASSAILVLTLGAAGLGPRTGALLALAAFAGALSLSLVARRGYGLQLERSLRTGVVRLEDLEGPAVRLALSATSVGLDRKTLIERIAERPMTPANDSSLQSLPIEVSILLGHDAGAILSVLARPALDRRLAAFVVPHLGNEAVAGAALSALRAMGPEVLGLLGDVLLGSGHPLAVRAKVPHALRAWRGPEVASILKRALTDQAAEVRHRAALALLEVTRRDRALRPDPKELIRLALQELTGPSSRAAARDHAFALLALATTQNAVELIRQGLRSHDPKLRGTALEYLESLLPEGGRAELLRGLSD